jgi:hypothetical protein
MTIKQQGGIFGRNPTFNDVEVDGVLDANEINAADLNATNEITAKSQVLTDTSGPVIRLSRNDTSLTTADRIGGIEFYQNDPSSAGAGVVAGIFCENESSFSGLGSLVFKVGDASSYDEVARINSSGNLKFINGQGIDFSATSGTGTSELFDDYEEGTYTVSLHDGSSGGNASSTTATGYYTKVGRVVTCSFSSLTNIDTSGMTSTNALYMSLPFTAAQAASGSMAISVVGVRQSAGQGFIVPYVLAANSRARFYGCESGSGVAGLRPAEITSGIGDFLMFTMTYIAS